MTRRGASWPAALLPGLLLVAGLIAAATGPLDSAGSSGPTVQMTVVDH